MTAEPPATPPIQFNRYRCGACAAGLHSICPVAVWSPGALKGKGAALYCPCARDSEPGEHPAAPRCRDCGSRESMLAPDLTCLDSADCLLRVARRLEADPTHQLIQECLTTREVNGQTVDRPRRPSRADRAKAKAEKVAKVARACECGCGGMTKGGAFLPGHDARLLSGLVRMVRSGELPRYEAADRLAGFPALQAKLGKYLEVQEGGR